MDEAGQKELNFARGLKSIGSLVDAADVLKKIVTAYPTWLEPQNDLSVLLWELGRFDEALSSIQEIINSTPDSAIAHLLLGHVLRETNKLDGAIAAYRKAIRHAPYSVESYHSLALALKENSQFSEAFEQYDHALLLAPNDAEIHNNRSILSLLLGEYSTGFAEYEWRKQKKERYGHRDFAQPLWRGEDLNGKTLLVHHEQGMGDAIQFSRYVKMLHDLGTKLIYVPHPPLVRLFSSMGDISFADADNSLINFDYHCPLLSLPQAIGTTSRTIPNKIPYLHSEPEKREKWRERIGDHGFKIGVAWQGSGGRYAGNRLFPVSFLKPLTSFAGVRLLGLHKVMLHAPWELPEGLHIEQLGLDFDAGSDAFIDAAAVIECCDLVISCDTAIAHLSGALGKSTWVVLRKVPHWIWMMERDDSPWYPTTRLFRQKHPGDWDSAFSEVYTEFSKLIHHYHMKKG